MVLYVALLNTQNYKVRIKDKVETIKGMEYRPPLCNIMAERFRFMPLGLVRLRSFWLGAWVRCNINTGVRARAQSGRVTQRCYNSRRLVSENDVTHRKHAEDFGRF